MFSFFLSLFSTGIYFIKSIDVSYNDIVLMYVTLLPSYKDSLLLSINCYHNISLKKYTQTVTCRPGRRKGKKKHRQVEELHSLLWAGL